MRTVPRPVAMPAAGVVVMRDGVRRRVIRVRLRRTM
jgi:hypothetical protein